MTFSDLHRHLDGSLRPSTLRDLSERKGIELPKDIKFYAGMGLDEALARFELTLSVLQSPRSLERVASEICEDAAAEDISTLEIRFGPHLHVREGSSIEEIIDAVGGGVAGRAGVILCGLYGDPPELLERFVDLARDRPFIVGLDLAGGPHPSMTWSLTDYARPFDKARAQGLGRTVHAGEGRPAAEIREAIERLHAQRIGHGTTLLDDPTLVDLILERGIVIEACPTSNVHTSAIERITEHPLHSKHEVRALRALTPRQRSAEGERRRDLICHHHVGCFCDLFRDLDVF